MPLRNRKLATIATAGTLALLLAHAAVYSFLCDDAFISFRYARNLAHGFGLVFNPGFERVEGYTNFLWVLLLAAGERIGISPEAAARPLSLLATVALWAVVVSWVFGREGPRAGPWAAAAAGAVLASARSVAVWSTGGLETRLFELLAVAGTLRLLLEIDADANSAARRPWSGLLLGLATLTRPDGALIGGCALGAGLVLDPERRRSARQWAARAAGFVLPVAAHTAFRLLYYGELVPNTYAAKVGGRFWWDMGLAYAGSFALEYGVFLWVPVLVFAASRHVRTGRRRDAVVIAAATMPHALYIIAIGGDHFEFRPFDLLFPFAAVLLASGLAECAERFSARVAIGAVAAVLFGLAWLPARSHAEFPRDRYRTGFPGMAIEDGAAARWLEPARDPLLRLPVLDLWPRGHRALLDVTSRAAVGLRQEEHAQFLATVRPEGRSLRAAIAAGEIPTDLHIALACVGAIPYESDLRTLDRLGLTDARVARMPGVSRLRVIAHERRDTAGYEREAGVDVSCVRAAHIFYPFDDTEIVFTVARAVARGGHPAGVTLSGGWLIGNLPQGLPAARQRHPSLDFRDLADPAEFDAFVRRSVDALGAHHARAPGDTDATVALAQGLLVGRDAERARDLFESVTAGSPDRIAAWTGLAGARAATGDRPGAREAIEHAADLARSRGAPEDLNEILPLLNRLSVPVQTPPSAR